MLKFELKRKTFEVKLVHDMCSRILASTEPFAKILFLNVANLRRELASAWFERVEAAPYCYKSARTSAKMDFSSPLSFNVPQGKEEQQLPDSNKKIACSAAGMMAVYVPNLFEIDLNMPNLG